MNWFHTPPSSAAEVCPSTWTMVLADQRGATPVFAGAAAFDAGRSNLVYEINQFRVAHRLAPGTSVVLWPSAGDVGVTSVDARATGRVSLPKARVIRDRVEPLVRAGGRVEALWLPHEAIEAVAATAGWRTAAVFALHQHGACLATIGHGETRSVYLYWDRVFARDATESARLLARYQLVSRLVPHVQQSIGDVQGPLFVCGTLPDLRPVAMALVEELDREIDVLDAQLIGAPDVDIDSVELPSLQLAWAAAAARQRRAAQRR